MARDALDAQHGLVALVRADGRGELREGLQVERFEAADSDALREAVLMRAMERAAELGMDLNLRTIDVDGIYPLRVTAAGDVQELGAPEPLKPGDTDLIPEVTPKHETLSLPRTAMMAALQTEPEEAAATAPAAAPAQAQAPAQAPAPAAAPEPPAPAPAREPASLETDEVPIVARLFADARAAGKPISAQDDDDADLDDYHDEGLDHDFDDVTEAEAAPASAAAAPKPAVSAAPLQEPTPEPEPWTPVFARDSARAAAKAAAAESAAAKPTTSNPAAAQPATGFPVPGLPAPTTPTLGTAPLIAAASMPAAPSVSNSASAPQPAASQPNASAASKPGSAAAGTDAPTLDDFFADAARPQRAIAEQGWRASLRKLTGGLITLPPGRAERAEQRDVEAIQRSFDGPRTIVVVNPKGGAHKTTTTLMIAAMFGIYRGGYTLAWDNNETRGTLGWRSRPANHTNTAVDLLRELPKFEISGGASINELDQYVRNQGYARFDVLASDDDAASAAIIDDDAFSRLHRVLSRFYRIMVIDTGNNMRASNWEAAVEAADQLVIVSTSREDTAASAAWLADGLRERGLTEKLQNAVTIISAPSSKEDSERTKRLQSHFSKLTRVVLSVPYDEEFVGGGELNMRALQPATRAAWRRVTAEIARGL